MRFIMVTLLIIICINKTFAQVNPGVQLSQKIAARLQDSLHLTSVQKDSIYAVNNRIHERKMQYRKQYAGSGIDSITHFLQITENSRDSLYKAVLTTEHRDLYIQKKGLLSRS